MTKLITCIDHHTAYVNYQFPISHVLVLEHYFLIPKELITLLYLSTSLLLR